MYFRHCAQITSGFYVLGDHIETVVRTYWDVRFRSGVLWLLVDNDLQGRIHVTDLAEPLIDEVYKAYTDGIPILKNYTTTRRGLYDAAFANVDLMNSESLKNLEGDSPLYTDLKVHLLDIKQHIRAYRRLGRPFINRGKQKWVKVENMSAVTELYEESCKAYITALLNFELGIVKTPQEELERRIVTIDRLDRSLKRETQKLQVEMSAISSLISSFVSASWSNVSERAHTAQTLLTQRHITRSELIQAINSSNLHMKNSDLDVLFATLRLRAHNLADAWRHMEVAWQSILEAVLSEHILREFYSIARFNYVWYVGTRIRPLPPNETNWYRVRLMDILHVDGETIDNTSVDLLRQQLNADFDTLNLTQELARVSVLTRGYEQRTDVLELLGDVDRTLQNIFHQMGRLIKGFDKEKTIGMQFYAYVYQLTSIMVTGYHETNIP